MTGQSNPQEGLRVRVGLLCIVSGSLDAISFLAFGEAFASVMTGNVVFVGLAAGNREGWLALSCGTAILGYVIGVAIGSRVVDRRPGVDGMLWPVGVTFALAVELVVIVGASVVWCVVGGEASDGAKLGFLACASVAMGIQGAAVRGIRASISTTYMTGALTALVHAMTRGEFAAFEARALVGLLSLCGGALIGSLVLDTWRPGALLVPAFALLIVTVLAVRSHRALAHVEVRA